MWIYSMYQGPVAGAGHGEFRSQKGDVSGMQQVRRSMVSAQAWDISRVWSYAVLVLIYPKDNEKSWEGFEESGGGDVVRSTLQNAILRLP